MAKKSKEPIQYNEKLAEYEIAETKKMAGHLDDCFQTAIKLEKDLNEKTLFTRDIDSFIYFIESPTIEIFVREAYLEGEEVSAGNVALDKDKLIEIIALPESFTRLQQLIAVWEDFKTRRSKIIEDYINGLELTEHGVSINQDYPERIRSRHRVFLSDRANAGHDELQKIVDQLNTWIEKYDYPLAFPGGDIYPLASTTLVAQRAMSKKNYYFTVNKLELLSIKDND